MAHNPSAALAATVSRTLTAWVLGLGCALGAAGAAHAIPIGFSVQNDGNDNLYRIDLGAGTTSLVGPVGFADVQGLSFQPSTGILFGVDDTTENLITIDTATGAGSVVGALGVPTVGEAGLAFNNAGDLFLADEDQEELFSVDPTSGAATFIGDFFLPSDSAVDITGIDFWNGILFGINEDDSTLVTIDTGTAALTTIGPLGISVDDTGLAFDATGTLWGIGDNDGIFTVNTSTGDATVTAAGVNNFTNLAIRVQATAVPAPATLGLLAIGLAGLAAAGRRRRT